MKRIARIALKAAVALLVVLGIAWAVVVVWERSVQSRLDQALAELKRQGAPVGLDWLDQPAVPPAEDALPLLRAASKAAESHPRPMAMYLKDYAEFTEKDWHEVAAWVKDQAEARELFAQAAAKRRCSWVYDKSKAPYAWIMEPISAVQCGSELLDAEIRVMIREGAPAAEVLDRIRLLPALARDVDDRMMIGWGVRFSVRSFAIERARELALRPKADLGLLQGWLRDFGDETSIRPLDRVLANERASSIAMLAPRYGGLGRTLDDITGPDRTSTCLSLLLHSPAAPLVDKLVAVNWLDTSAPAIEASRRVDAASVAKLEALKASTTRAWYDPFGNPVLVRASRLARMLVARRAKITVTHAGLTLIEWKRNHGAWPSDLAQAGIRTKDPFTGGPLGYEKTEAGGVRIFVELSRERWPEVAWKLGG